MKRESDVAKVIFHPLNVKIAAPVGKRLADLMETAGIEADFPCGCKGRCGKCRVKFIEGALPPTARERGFLSETEISGGIRLACEQRVLDDCVIELPPGRAWDFKASLALGADGVTLNPYVRKIAVTVDPPSPSDLRGDWERVIHAAGAATGRAGTIVAGETGCAADDSKAVRGYDGCVCGEQAGSNEDWGDVGLGIAGPDLSPTPAGVQPSGIVRDGAPDMGFFRIPLSVLRWLPTLLRDANFRVTLVLGGNEAIAVEPGDTSRTLYGMAIDVGTTTVAGYLCDLLTGKQAAVVSAQNPQVAHGADIITRITYAMQEESGLSKLQSAVAGAVNGLVEEAASQAGIRAEDIYCLTVAGNTCMHHLFFGIDPKHIGLYPYVPAVTGPLKVTASELGIKVNPAGLVLALPNVAGFVGADTVAMALALDLDRKPGVTLAVDIGTNGEIVLAKDGRMLACSAAAGPAFEGVQISSGIRASNGAIDHVWEVGRSRSDIGLSEDRAYDVTRLDRVDGRSMNDAGPDAVADACSDIGMEHDTSPGRHPHGHAGIERFFCVEYSVIGGGRPEGICGSGLLDAVASLLRQDVISSKGEIVQASGVVERDGHRAFVLAEGAATASGSPILLTQKDVRELQLAKGAILAGVRVLLDRMGIGPEAVDEVLLAGAFGNYLDPASAFEIGLFPREMAGRVRQVGNAAGAGALAALRSKEEYARAGEIGKTMEYVELAAVTRFHSLFVSSLYFR